MAAIPPGVDFFHSRPGHVSSLSFLFQRVLPVDLFRCHVTKYNSSKLVGILNPGVYVNEPLSRKLATKDLPFAAR